MVGDDGDVAVVVGGGDVDDDVDGDDVMWM